MNPELGILLPEPYKYSMGYIILPLHALDVAKTVSIDGETLYAKEKFHMSILGIKNYAKALTEKLQINPGEAEERILRESARILGEKPVRFLRFVDDIRLVEEDDKKTIAVMCEAENLDNFFDKLREALGIEIATQPVHSTIYTREGGCGIGMINQDELDSFSKPLTEDELPSVKEALNWDKLSK